MTSAPFQARLIPIAVIAILTAVPLPGGSKARAWEEPLPLPTWEIQDPDHNPRVYAGRAYYEEALRRDPEDSRVNLALGIRNFRRGLFEDAEKRFRTALKRPTHNYTSPRDGEALYYASSISSSRIPFFPVLAIAPDSLGHPSGPPGCTLRPSASVRGRDRSCHSPPFQTGYSPPR